MSLRYPSIPRLSIGPLILWLTLVASIPLVAQSPQVSSPPRPAKPLPAPAGPPSDPTIVPLRERDWNTMSVEVTVRQWQQMTAGEAPPNQLPAQRYRLERSMASGQWKTVLTMLDRTRANITTSEGVAPHAPASEIVRVEYDEDGSPARYFNQRGERVVTRAPKVAASQAASRSAATPATASQAIGGATPLGLVEALQHHVSQQSTHRQQALPAPTREWADGLVVSRADRAQRRRALESRLGPAVGKVRGLDRLLRANGSDLDEVLIEPESGVPIEMNHMKDGQLVSRRTFAYQQRDNGDLVRRSMRTESLVSGDTTRHRVIEVEFSNLIFERRR